jgi:hypothetical protein
MEWYEYVYLPSLEKTSSTHQSPTTTTIQPATEKQHHTLIYHIIDMEFTVATIVTLAAVAFALHTEVAAPKDQTSKPYIDSIRPLTDLQLSRRSGIHHLPQGYRQRLS